MELMKLNVRDLSVYIFLVSFWVTGVPHALGADSVQMDKNKKLEIAGEIVSVEGVVFVRADGRESQGKLVPAKAGDSIRAGDVVNTSSNGKIKILMKDKSLVDLGPSALFKVDEFKKGAGTVGTDRQVDVSMMYGTMRTAVTQKITGNGRFRVRTPTATMGVRGTEFVVKSEVKNLDQVKQIVKNPDKPLAAPPVVGTDGKKVEAPKTEITVLQGKVDVAKKEEATPGGRKPADAGKVVSLTAGMQVSTKQGEAAPLKAVTLDTKQLSALNKETKVLDNTFTKAVVIEPSAFKDAAAGEATRSMLSAAIAIPQTPQISLGDIGFAGTFGSNQALNKPSSAQQQQLGSKRLRVIIVAE